MTIDEIIDYVSNTPENSNPAVLKAMLEQLEGTGGSGNSGGSSSDVNVTIVNIVYTGATDGESHLDKTYGEIQSAFEQGPVLIKGQKTINVYNEATGNDDLEVSGTAYQLVFSVSDGYIYNNQYGPAYPSDKLTYSDSSEITISLIWWAESDSDYPTVYWD